MSEAVAILVIIFGHFTAYLLALYSLAIYIDPDEVKTVVPGLAPRRKNFLLRLADNPRSFKRVAVVYKSLALILITTMTGFLAVKLAVSAGVSPAWVIVPALLLVWTGYILLIEYLPRSMSRRAIKPSMMRWVWLIAAIYYLCYPMLWLYHRAMGRSRDDTPVTEEEKEELVERAIETLADEAGIGETIVEEEEKEMIGQIFLLDQTVAREIMVPRMDITAIDKSMSFKEIREIVLKDGHSRYPVYDGAIDKIIGLIYVKDLFNKMPEPGENFNIDQYLRKPYFWLLSRTLSRRFSARSRMSTTPRSPIFRPSRTDNFWSTPHCWLKTCRIISIPTTSRATTTPLAGSSMTWWARCPPRDSGSSGMTSSLKSNESRDSAS